MYSKKDCRNGLTNDIRGKEFKTAEDIIQYIKNNNIELVDCCFSDPLGMWHHCTFSSDLINEKCFTEGLAFDGSSIKSVSQYI